MLGQLLGDRVLVEALDQHATVVEIVVRQTEQRQHRRPDVGVVGPGRRIDAIDRDTWAGQADPRGRDLGLDAPVAPSEVVIDARVRAA